jgi:hypothetical protein
MSAYYLRFQVLDVPGVMAEISRHLANEMVSIESMIQRGRAPGEPVAIVMITHESSARCGGSRLEGHRRFGQSFRNAVHDSDGSGVMGGLRFHALSRDRGSGANRMSRPLDRILALEAVRVTEAAAMRAFKLAGGATSEPPIRRRSKACAGRSTCFRSMARW